MFLDTLEKIRKQPLEVRRQIMFLITIVVVMVVTIVWAGGYILTSDLFKAPPPSQPIPEPAPAPADAVPQGQ